jgi:hypothetical protein
MEGRQSRLLRNRTWRERRGDGSICIHLLIDSAIHNQRNERDHSVRSAQPIYKPR